MRIQLVILTIIVQVLTIEVSGLSINEGSFWHVTDFHYDHTYWTSQLSCNDDVPNPGPVGDYWCDSPWRLVQDAISGMASIKPDVDFILWTGDTVAHIDDEDLSLDLNMEIIENITNVFSTSFPGIPVYATLGNHDFYPSDQAEPERSAVYERVGEIWKDWLRTQTRVDAFGEGGYYTALIRPGLRVVALNTNLYYTSNHITENVTDPAGQLSWLDQTLSQARTAHEKVILTAHIPPGLATPGLRDSMYPDHKTAFMNVLLRYTDVIIAGHFGHDHSDGFKLLQSSNVAGAIPQYTAPSVTPWRYRIPSATGAPHNPGIRLIEYDRDTGHHIDYHQYFINLPDGNDRNSIQWEKLYSFRDAYRVSDMSVSSLRAIFDRVKDGDNADLTSQFCRYALVMEDQTPCTDQMRGQIYCGGLFYDHDVATVCVNDFLDRINTAGVNFCLPSSLRNMSALLVVIFMYLKVLYT